MQTTSRRAVLGWLGAAGALASTRALGGCADAALGGSDAGRGIDSGGYQAPDGGYHVPDVDAGEACVPTRPDAQGPFFAPEAPSRTNIATPEEPGQRLVILGQVLADDCTTPIAGALLDVWQADATGSYHDAGTDYRLRGQLLSDAQGGYSFSTIKPGNYETAPGAWRPAHIHFTVSAPGFAPVTTQLYFAGDRYLPPNDSCTGCGSDDAARVITLYPGEGALIGDFRIVLRLTP
jgi:catechol 1,2-dioxygenase